MSKGAGAVSTAAVLAVLLLTGCGPKWVTRSTFEADSKLIYPLDLTTASDLVTTVLEEHNPGARYRVQDGVRHPPVREIRVTSWANLAPFTANHLSFEVRPVVGVLANGSEINGIYFVCITHGNEAYREKATATWDALMQAVNSRVSSVGVRAITPRKIAEAALDPPAPGASPSKPASGAARAQPNQPGGGSTEAEATGTRATTKGDIEDRLRKLDDLKKKGLISDEEYKSKRQSLLDQL